jgi:uroporphyrin-III C-methyltransferase
MAAGMPAAVVSAAHTPQQRHARCTLETLAATVAAEGLVSPAVLVLGAVAQLGQALAGSSLPLDNDTLATDLLQLAG